MRLAFLFLPFVGTRDYHTYRFHVNGKRYERTSASESCILCRHVRKITHQDFIYLGTTTPVLHTYECAILKKTSGKFTSCYEKHPCTSYHEKGKLKQL